MSYDQWKTASPYDNDVDWAEYGVSCPKCGNDIMEDRGSAAGLNRVALHCEDCGHEWDLDMISVLGYDPADECSTRNTTPETESIFSDTLEAP